MIRSYNFLLSLALEHHMHMLNLLCQPSGLAKHSLLHGSTRAQQKSCWRPRCNFIREKGKLKYRIFILRPPQGWSRFRTLRTSESSSRTSEPWRPPSSPRWPRHRTRVSSSTSRATPARPSGSWPRRPLRFGKKPGMTSSLLSSLDFVLVPNTSRKFSYSCEIIVGVHQATYHMEPTSSLCLEQITWQLECSR